MFCIPQYLVDEFRKRIRSGEISPDKMINMTSAQRRSYFAEFLGDANAQKVNYLLEKNLMLKDQQRGLVKWAEQVAGMKKEHQRDLLSKVEKMEDLLTPETEDAFLEDLAGHKLGINVTLEEAANITELARIATEAREKMEAGERRPENSTAATPNELEYGRALIAFDNYLNGLKQKALKRSIPQVIEDSLRDPIGALRDLVIGASGTTKAIVSSVDNSFVGRQGIQVFYKGLTGDVASAKTWIDTFNRSFKAIYDTFRGKPVMDELNAVIVSDPEYQMLRRARVAIGTIEEAYPVSWPGRIPVLGKVFEASENAYVGSSYWMRYRVAKNYLNIARKTGIDLTDPQELQSIGALTNSLTARGDTGAKRQTPGVINNVFWSPKMIKGALDVLTAHQFDPNISAFAKKQAALNLLQVIVGTGIVLAIAKLIDDDSVDLDPRSADYGKIKVGNTRFSVNPYATFVTLAARILVPTKHEGKWGLWSKSSTSGKYTNLLEKKYGQQTAMDVFEGFLENKTAPLASQIVNIWKNQSSRDWRKPYDWREGLLDLVTPMSAQNANELLNDPESANLVIGMIADGLGSSTNTYSRWGNYTDAELAEKVQNYLKKNGLPRKGYEEDARSIIEEQQRRARRNRGIQ